MSRGQKILGVIIIFVGAFNIARLYGAVAGGGDDVVGIAGLGVMLATSGSIYLLPSLIAVLRRHRSRGGIVALNVVAGWTVIGWLGSLVWCLTGERGGASKASA